MRILAFLARNISWLVWSCITVWVLTAIIAVVGLLYLWIDPWATKYLFGGWLVDWLSYNETVTRYGPTVLRVAWIAVLIAFAIWLGQVTKEKSSPAAKPDKAEPAKTEHGTEEGSRE